MALADNDPRGHSGLVFPVFSMSSIGTALGGDFHGPTPVKSAADARKIVGAQSHPREVGVFDAGGSRAASTWPAKFLSALDGGFGSATWSWADSNDQLYDNTTATGWHTGYPDAAIGILPDTCRELPGGTTRCSFWANSPRRWNPSARATRRVLAAADKMGYRHGRFEYNFRLRGNAASIRAKHYRDPAARARPFRLFGPAQLGPRRRLSGYSGDLRAHGLALEALHEETGAGVLKPPSKADGWPPPKGSPVKTFVRSPCSGATDGDLRPSGRPNGPARAGIFIFR